MHQAPKLLIFYDHKKQKKIKSLDSNVSVSKIEQI